MILAALTAVAVVQILFISGYLVGRKQAWAAAQVKLEQDIDRVVAKVAARRTQDIEQLARLRVWLETETDGVTAAQALLLTDVCTQLGYTQAETQHIVGPAYLMVVDAPISASASEMEEGDR